MKKSSHGTFLDFLIKGRKTKEKTFSPMSVLLRDGEQGKETARRAS